MTYKIYVVLAFSAVYYEFIDQITNL